MPRAIMALEKLAIVLVKNKSTMHKYISEELSLLLQNPMYVHSGNIAKAYCVLFNIFKDLKKLQLHV